MVAKKKSSRKAKKPVPKKTLLKKPPKISTTTKLIYIDSCLFFPSQSVAGYSDNFQDGRNTVLPGLSLLAPLALPVNSIIKSITVYYKNTTNEDMQCMLLKKHIDHHAYSGEVEVTIDTLPPATLAPDNYVAKLIDHFDSGGLVKDKYMYYVEIDNTGKVSETELRTLRGIRVEYL
jgi:hypothetical protein